MLVKLKSIAKIKSGYSFRGSLDLNSSGNVFILQAKNILSDVEVDDDFSLEQINLNFKNENIFLQKKDIVFLSKTGPQADFRSAVFNSNKKQVIFSNTILSIRIENSNIIPEYLSIYLNSNECKKDLQKISIGSITKHIPPNFWENLKYLYHH